MHNQQNVHDCSPNQCSARSLLLKRRVERTCTRISLTACNVFTRCCVTACAGSARQKVSWSAWIRPARTPAKPRFGIYEASTSPVCSVSILSSHIGPTFRLISLHSQLPLRPESQSSLHTLTYFTVPRCFQHVNRPSSDPPR